MAQFQEYLEENNLLARTQSAYRRHHSVETALIRVQTDCLQALDTHREVIIVLLDFTAAFDTIDHGILLERLHDNFGVSANALKWFHSYLEGRNHVVRVNNASSTSPVEDTCGVPQGSVIGPLLFTLYTAPIHDIISAHGLQSMIYADDTQIYLTFEPSERASAVHQVNKCITDIRLWAGKNKLTINDGKTEVMHLSSRFLPKTPSVTLTVGETGIEARTEARNLGIIFDEHITRKSHIAKVCRSAMSSIRKIGQIRGVLDRKTTLTLVHAFVTSKLDTCNALLTNLPANDLIKLQRIQNIAARITERATRHTPTTSLFHNLHWLPISKRIHFKTLLLTYKCLSGSAPPYLAELIHAYTPSRALRSQNKHLLQVPRFKTQYYGQSSFTFAAPTLWNSLPLAIRTAPTLQTFKTLLKTYLFKN